MREQQMQSAHAVDYMREQQMQSAVHIYYYNPWT